MKIMLTNDDGYFAKGIQYLYDFLVGKGHQVYIVAPKEEKSAASSSLTIRGALELEKIDDHTYAVGGTPVDSIKIGLHACSDDGDPDLVISGINLGPNLGTDTLYSGTVGAAMDAAVLGFRSIALSTNREFMAHGPGKDFDKYLEKAIDIATNSDVPKHTMLNINIPRNKIKGIKSVPIGMVMYRGNYSTLKDSSNTYYLSAMRDDKYNISNDVDDRYFHENYMTVTPLSYDMTNYKVLKDMDIDE